MNRNHNKLLHYHYKLHIGHNIVLKSTSKFINVINKFIVAINTLLAYDLSNKSTTSYYNLRHIQNQKIPKSTFKFQPVYIIILHFYKILYIYFITVFIEIYFYDQKYLWLLLETHFKDVNYACLNMYMKFSLVMICDRFVDI